MSYVGARPWHGLGTQVNEGATGMEMLKAAKLDYPIEMREISFMLPGPTGELIDPLKIYRAVTRGDNDRVFQVATYMYHPVQNIEIIDFFREYCEAGNATMETVGALKGGAIVWALAKLSKFADTSIKGVDELTGYMLLATSHDGTMATIGRGTQVRVVCWNTLSAALGRKGGKQFRMSHSRQWTEKAAQEARETMGMAAEQVQRANEIATVLAGISINNDDWLDFMGKLMGEENVKDIKKGALTRTAQAIMDSTINSPGSDLVTAKGTLWGLVNGISHFVDHKRGRTDDSRLTAAWFGDGERLKNDGLALAMQMAGVN
jgi:phage/plasmid-like protein (TIGR03299 family)